MSVVEQSEVSRVYRASRLVRGAVPAPVRARLAGVRSRWLTAVASKAVVRHLLLPLLAALCIRTFIAAVQATNGSPISWVNNKFASEITTDLLLIVLGWALVQFSRTWGVRAMMRSVYAIAAVTQNPYKAVHRNYAVAEINRVLKVVQQLSQGTYRAENPEELRKWFDALFADGGRWYRAVDSNPPSAYMRDYAWYLDTHSKALAERARADTFEDIRVLTTPRDQLTKDYAKFTGLYGEYYEWHREHHVDARWLATDKVNRLRAEYNIGKADVGLWENHAVLFTPDEHSDAVTIDVYVPGEARPGRPSYVQITQYVAEVLKQSEDLGDVAPRLELVDQKLANNWEAYLDPMARQSGPFGKFLLGALSGRQWILDAAAGIGSDSVFLLEQGFTVWSNEVDLRLAEVANAYAAARNVQLHLTGFLWETLPESMVHDGNMRFDAVLVLGNSLCLVPEESQRRVCLRAFHDILQPGGKLIIDERYFQYMLDFRSEIEKSPGERYPPTLRGDVMYGGMSVRGYPARISQQAISWRFFSNSPPVSGDRNSIVERDFKVKELALYPFRHGELYSLLCEVGFQDIEVFSDMKKIGTPDEMPSRESVGDAVFVTYVATRPNDSRVSTPVDLTSHPQGPGA